MLRFIYLHVPTSISSRLHDPAGFHRAAAAAVAALAAARPAAAAGLPAAARPGQRHPGPPAQPDQRQHAQLALRPLPQQLLLQHQCSPSGPLPGEHPTGVRRPGAPGPGESAFWGLFYFIYFL